MSLIATSRSGRMVSTRSTAPTHDKWHFDEPDGLRIEGIAIGGDTVLVFTDVPGPRPRPRPGDRQRSAGRKTWIDGSLGGGAITDGLLYIVGSEDGLSAIDTSTGDVAWSVPLEVTAKPSRLVVTGGLVIAATTVDGAGRVVAFAGASDPRRQVAPSPNPTPALEAPAVGNQFGASRDRSGRAVDVHEVDPEADARRSAPSGRMGRSMCRMWRTIGSSCWDPMAGRAGGDQVEQGEASSTSRR